MHIILPEGRFSEIAEKVGGINPSFIDKAEDVNGDADFLGQFAETMLGTRRNDRIVVSGGRISYNPPYDKLEFPIGESVIYLTSGQLCVKSRQEEVPCASMSFERPVPAYVRVAAYEDSRMEISYRRREDTVSTLFTFLDISVEPHGQIYAVRVRPREV